VATPVIPPKIIFPGDIWAVPPPVSDEIVSRRSVLPSAAGVLKLPRLSFSSRVLPSALSTINLNSSSIAIPQGISTTAEKFSQPIRTVVTIQIEDVSTFSIPTVKPEVAKVAIIVSPNLPTVEHFYEDQLPFSQKVPLDIPKNIGMPHPADRWNKPKHIEVKPIGLERNW
jgi:hypothetical protein